MAVYLIKTTEVYRADSEKEAKEWIERAKADKTYTVTRSSSEIKTRTHKGEIEDEWRRVTLQKKFTEEKEPVEVFRVEYTELEDNGYSED